MARMSDPWLAAFEEAKLNADEVMLLLSERDEAMAQGGQENVVMRLTAAARRKWSALGSRLEQLEKALPDGGQCVASRPAGSCGTPAGVRREIVKCLCLGTHLAVLAHGKPANRVFFG